MSFVTSRHVYSDVEMILSFAGPHIVSVSCLEASASTEGSQHLYLPSSVPSDFHLNQAGTTLQKKSNVCNMCGRAYKWQISLQRHMRVECGQAPKLQCNICLRCFRHKHHLNSHLLTHRRNVTTHSGKTEQTQSPSDTT